MTEPLESTDEQLSLLIQGLDVSEGTSSFSLAQCDRPETRDRLIAELQEQFAGIEVVRFPPGSVDVFGYVKDAQLPATTKAIFLVDLELSLLAENGRHTWRSLNASRDLWRNRFPCPVVFWLPEEAARQFRLQATDFSRFIDSRYFFAPDRFSVFISYSHADDEWRKKLEKFLQPAMREGRLDAWSDTKIQAGDDWRSQIEQALQRAQVGVLLVSPDFLASKFIMEEELPFLLQAADERGVTLVWLLISACGWEHTPLKNIQAAHDTKNPLKKLRGHNRDDVLTKVATLIRTRAVEKSRQPAAPPPAAERPPEAPDEAEPDDSLGDRDHFHADRDFRGERDDFLARVEQVCRLRHPTAKITRVRDPRSRLAYLRVVIPVRRFTVTQPVAAFAHGVLPTAFDDFARLVQEEYRQHDPGVQAEIVYGGETLDAALVDNAWKQHRILLTSYVEYQGITDFRRYIDQQSRTLERDPLYPPRLYVPQRASVQSGTDRADVDNVLQATLAALDSPHPRFVLVLGDFGTGKTFLQHQLALQLGQANNGLTPVLIEMRALEKGRTLDELIAQHFARTMAGHDGQPIDLDAFRYMLSEGRIALLFDGFDELALRVTYDRATEHFETLLQAAQGRAKIVLTSRTTNFENEQQVQTALFRRVTPLQGLRVVRLKPFDEKQIVEFLGREYPLRIDALLRDPEALRRVEQEDQHVWSVLQRFLAGRAIERLTADERTELIGEAGRQLRDERLALIHHVEDLRGLAANPRMLSFIVDVEHEKLEEARARHGRITSAELYRLLIGRWLQHEFDRLNPPGRGYAPGLTKDELWTAVFAVARRLWKKVERTVTASELEDDVSRVLDKLHERRMTAAEAAHAVGLGALMVWDEQGRLTFVHQSILEWLVAEQCARELVAARREPSGESSSSARDRTARAVPLTTLPEALTQNRLSPLAADFVRDLATVEIAAEWAGQTLAAELPADWSREALDTVKFNAALVAKRCSERQVTKHEPLDLSGRDLRGQDLTGLDLRGANLAGTNLSEVVLAERDLSGADLRGAVLVEADMRRAKLVGAELTDADLTRANLVGADLQDVHGTPKSLWRTKVAGTRRVPSLWVDDADGAALREPSGDSGDQVARATPLLAATLSAASPVNSVAWHRAGDLLATGHDDGSVRLWDVTSGRELRSFAGHEGYVWSVSFSPDGARLASGGNDYTVRLWNVTSGQELRCFVGHEGIVWSVSFGPDGARLASGSTDRTVRLWDVASGQELCRFNGHAGFVQSVSFSPDGARLASGSDDNSVRLWDVNSGQELRRLIGHESFVQSVSFSPDGARLASGSCDNTVRLWDVHSGKEVRRCDGHTNTVRSVSFSPDGTRLASGSDDCSVRLWDVTSGQELRLFSGREAGVRSVSFNPDGARLASGGDDGSLRLWDVNSGQELRRFASLEHWVWSVSFSPDGARLASGGDDRSVRLWDVTSGQELRRCDGHEWGVRSLSFSPDGTRLASAGDDNSVRLWDATSGRELCRFDGHESWVRSVSFSPDGARLASGSYDETVRLWDVTSGRELRRFTADERRIESVTFSPDGAWLASGSSDNSVRLWDVTSGQELRRFDGHMDFVRSVSFSPDGTRLASGSDDESVCVWDVTSGQEFRCFSGHANAVWSVSFSPNGARLVSGGFDQSVRLWDVATGQELRHFLGHGGAVRSVVFHRSGRFLASGSADGTIKLWDVESGDCLATLFAAEEGWVAFLPDGRYKLSGNLGGSFWHVIGLCRYEPGELDDVFPGLRLPLDAPLLPNFTVRQGSFDLPTLGIA